MDLTLKVDENERAMVLAEEDPTNKLIPTYTSGDVSNTRDSVNIISPKHSKNVVNISPSRDARRSSESVLDFQKEEICDGGNIKVYKRRWIVLCTFLLYAISGAFQWPMYSIIANIITKYYNVSNLAVECTTTTFLISYTLAFLPAGWIMNNLGLQWAMLLGSFLNFIGCLCRVFSVPQDKFWLTMTGQSIVGLSQVFGTMIPARIAAVWFPAHQVSFACSFAFNGFMIGNAVGFLGLPIFVRNSDNLEEIAGGLNRVYIGLAIQTGISFLLTLAIFQDEPPLPPSEAQRLQRLHRLQKRSEAGQKSKESTTEFMKTVLRLFKMRSFMILLISMSFNIGVFIAFGAMLNKILIPHFPGCEREVGIVGLMLVVPGIVSSVIFGAILDRTHAFKSNALGLYLLTLAGWVAFAYLLPLKNMFWLYIASGVLGFSTGAAWLVSLELAVEITYPEPEGTMTGILGAELQLFGIFYTLFYGYMLEVWGDFTANSIMAVPILMGCVTLAFMRPKLKRQAAQQMKSLKELEDTY